MPTGLFTGAGDSTGRSFGSEGKIAILRSEAPTNLTALLTRESLLTALADLGQRYPDWRLGQMLANLATTAGRLDAGAVWDLEDDEALAAARELLAAD